MFEYAHRIFLGTLLLTGCAGALVPPADAADVQVGLVNRSVISAACATKAQYVAQGVTDPSGLPAEVQEIVQRSFDLCGSVFDLNAQVGGEPTNAQIKAAISTLVAARQSWQEGGQSEFPDPPAFTFSKASLPGGCADVSECATTTSSLCALVQSTPTAESCRNIAGETCRSRCDIDSGDGGGKLWAVVYCSP